MSQLADTEPPPRSGPAFPLLESKLHPPPARPTLVLRSALVERVAQASSVAVVTIVAPPGYGKTTLLTQLAEPVARRAAWLSLDDGDNDPEILLSYVAGALDRVEAIDPDVFRMVKLRGFSVASTAARRLADAMEAMAEPPVLFLDHVESLHNPECLDAIAALALHLPAGSRLMLASRDDAADRASARMRAADALLEIGVDDLAMDPAASRALLIARGSGARRSRDGRARRADRGLAGRPLPRGARVPRGWRRRRGGAVVLRRRPAARRLPAFRAAVPPVGIRRLVPHSDVGARPHERSPLRRGARHRRVGRDPRVARALEPVPRGRSIATATGTGTTTCSAISCAPSSAGANPDAVVDIHRRAAAWCEANGQPEVALAHAQQAGDGDHVAALVLALMQPVWASGRLETVLRWMEWFEREHLIEHYPAVAVHGALDLRVDGPRDRSGTLDRRRRACAA